LITQAVNTARCGEIYLTYVAVQKKLAVTVIDDVCRDLDGIKELNYPMFTKGYFMVTGKDRVELQSNK